MRIKATALSLGFPVGAAVGEEEAAAIDVMLARTEKLNRNNVNLNGKYRYKISALMAPRRTWKP
jgi:hypothetical protein